MLKGTYKNKGFDKVADLVEIAGSLQPLTAVMAGGERVEDLLLVESARDHGILNRIVLVGKKQKISDAVAKVGIHVPRKDILAADSDEEAAAATAGLLKAGGVQMVLKGSTPTHVLHRHMLPLAIRSTVSLVSIFDAAPIANGRPMILTDAGVTTVCNYARIAGLIQNAVDVARHVMGIEKPRVALLSANEKILPTLPSTQLGAAFARRGWPGASVYGPLSLDLATDPGAVASKGLPDISGAGEVAGKADILVCPNIDTGNVIYKMVSALIKYGEASLANIIMGFPKPYVLLSRSDALETRLNSLALGAIYAQCGLGEHPAPVRRSSVRIKPKPRRIVVLNPCSRFVKFSLFEDDRCVRNEMFEYSLSPAVTVKGRQRQVDQLTHGVLQILNAEQWKTTDAIVARGRLLPYSSESHAAYSIAERRGGNIDVNKMLMASLLAQTKKQPDIGLGVSVTIALAGVIKAPAYVVDSAAIEGVCAEADTSVGQEIIGSDASYVLSICAAARKAAQSVGRPLEDINLVVGHLDADMMLAAIRNARMTDSNIARVQDGACAPQPPEQPFISELIELCRASHITSAQRKEAPAACGGNGACLSESHLRIIDMEINAGNGDALRIVDALAYQVAKGIGAVYVAAGCDVEAIVLTGAMIRIERVRNEIRRHVGRLAPLLLFEQPPDMEALAAEALRVLAGESKARRRYRKQPDTSSNRRTPE